MQFYPSLHESVFSSPLFYFHTLCTEHADGAGPCALQTRLGHLSSTLQTLILAVRVGSLSRPASSRADASYLFLN